MPDEQAVAPGPGSGPVQVQGLQVRVSLPPGPGGLGLVDPALGDEQPAGEEALRLEGPGRVLQGAVEAQQRSDRSLSLTENETMGVKRRRSQPSPADGR